MTGDKSKTLYITDLDGTLLNQNAELSASSAKKLNELIASGARFSIATARTPATALKIVSEVKLNIPVVLLNGVLIYDTANGRYPEVRRLQKNTVESILSVMRGLRVTGLMYAFDGGGITTYYEAGAGEPIRSFIEERKRKYRKRFTLTDFAEAAHDNIIYFTLLDTYEAISSIGDALSGLEGLGVSMFKDNYTPELWYLEVSNETASKCGGVEFIKNELGFDRVVGFGDNLNDLPMFEACDIRVAVKNARREVLDAADHICGSNLEDGVPNWIEKHFNGRL